MSKNRYSRISVTAVAAGLLVLGCARSQRDTGVDAQVTEEESGLFARAAITPDSAMVIAKARVPGRITKAELETENNVLLYSFDIKAPGKGGTTEVHVDAGTGAILKVGGE